MNILITGGTGFIGSNISRRLFKQHNVFAPSSNELNLLDQESVEAYFKANNFDTLIHCATWNPVSSPNKDRNKILENNLRMFFNLLREKERFDKFICFGSGADFSKPYWVPMVEEGYFDQHVPLDDYGFSKYLITKHIQKIPNTVNLRLFGVFGRGEDWRIRFISNAICHALHDLPIYIIQDVLFDYLYIEDLIDIVDWFLKNKPEQKTFNICTGRTYLLTDLAKIVLDVLDKELPVQVLKKGYGREYSGDNSRLRSEMEELRFTPMKKAIEDLAQWYITQFKRLSYNEIKDNRLVLLSQQQVLKRKYIDLCD